MIKNGHIENDEPKGKRSIRTTVYGNVNGYIGGKFWLTIGEAYSKITDQEAAEWLAKEVKK